MAVRTREEIMELVRQRFANDTTDESINFIEDLNDTLESVNEVETLRTQIKTIDDTWRKKYRDRFFSKKDKDAENIEEEKDDQETQKDYRKIENLFK